MRIFANNDFKDQSSCLFPFFPELYGSYTQKTFNIEDESKVYQISFKQHRKDLAVSWKQTRAEACRKRVIAWHDHINDIIENNPEFQFDQEKDLIKALKENKLVQAMAFTQLVLKYHKNHETVKVQPQLYKAMLQITDEQKSDISAYTRKYRKHRPAFSSCTL